MRHFIGATVLRVAAVAFASAAATAAQEAARPARAPSALLLTAARVRPVDGPETTGGVLIVDGKIKVVGKDAAAAAPAGVEKIDFPGAVVFPGLVDAASYAGVRREADALTTPFSFDVRIIDAVDPRHPAFGRLAAAGITTSHLLPGDRDVVGGRSAVVKATGDGALKVLKAEAGLKASFAQGSYPDGRAPTSVQGALEAFEHADAELRAALAPWADPKTAIFATARSDRDVALAGAVRRAFGRPVAWFTTFAAGGGIDALKAAATGIVLDPLPPYRPAGDRAKLVRLFGAGLPIAFGTYAPIRHATTLRVSAAAAVAWGVAEEPVERALTLDAARILGVADRVGSLTPGKDGDVCVFSGPPTDPRSRLLLTVQDGRVVHRAPAPEKRSDS